MTSIKASITAGVRPSVFILGADSRKPWNKWDRVLMEAYQTLENERCPQCGTYRWICGNEDPDIQVRVDYDFCAMKARTDQINDANRKKTNFEPNPGETMRPQPYTVSGADLVDYRDAYYKAQATRQRAIEETVTRGT